MKLSKLGILAFLLPLAVSACSGDDTEGGPAVDGGSDTGTPSTDSGTGGTPVTDATPDRGTTDGPTGDATPDASGDAADAAVEAEAAAPPVAQLDTTAVRQTLVTTDAKAVAILPTLQGIVDLMVGGNTLTLSGTAADNASNIGARITTYQNDYCANLGVGYVADMVETWARAVFPTSGCLLNGLAISATTSTSPAIIKATTTKAGGTLTIAIALTDVLVNGVKLTGTLTVTKSTNVTGLPFVTTDLKADGTSIKFTSTSGSVERPDGGAPLAKVSGTGTLPLPTGGDAGTGVNVGADGWTCVQQGDSDITATNLSRVLDDCYPNAGSVKVQKAFVCQKIVNGQPYTQTVESTSTLDFQSNATTVRVTTDTEIGDASTSGTPSTVSLPACGIQEVDAGGKDSGADTGTDATTVDSGTDATTTDAAADAASE